eukprot:TRINITY_DN10718_c0_g1_i3.p1 TRINITY_DN10718_c0_g1~~TRINITY_DN10718_c0_g1_i3.p1  ORF type:complete len:811 (+),score=174.92 TRINITY_DN10718_c0_g1_i3:98-2530(+)
MGDEWSTIASRMQEQHYNLLCQQDRTLFSTTFTELDELKADDSTQIISCEGPEERGVATAVTLWVQHTLRPKPHPAQERRHTVTSSSDLSRSSGTKPPLIAFYYASLSPSSRSVRSLLVTVLQRLALFHQPTTTITAETSLNSLSRTLVDTCRAIGDNQPVYLCFFDLDNLFYDRHPDWAWLQDLPANTTIVTTSSDTHATRGLRRRPGFKRLSVRPFARPQAIAQCTRTLSEGMGKLVTQAQVVGLFKEHKVKRYAGLLSKTTCPALEWYRWYLLSTVPQMTRQADAALRQAHTINQAASLSQLWSICLELTLQHIDQKHAVVAGQCLVLLAHSTTGLSISELGLLTTASTLDLRKHILKPFAVFFGATLDTTDPLSFRHPCIAQVIISMPSYLRELSSAVYDYNSVQEGNGWAKRSLWRLFLSLKHHQPELATRCQHELTDLPKTVLQLNQESPGSTSSIDLLVAAADPSRYPSQLSFDNSQLCQDRAGFQEVLQALRCHRAFVSVDMSNTGLDDEQGKQLADTLALCPKVNALRITKNNISKQTVLAMALLLPADLHVSGLEGWSQAASLAALKEGLATTIHFDQSTPLSGSVIGFAATRMANNATLTKVTLTHQSMSDKHAAELGTALAQLPQLTTLKWTRCELNNDGILALCQGLTASSKLRQLDISRNKLRDATGTAIGKAMARGWKLVLLNLSHNLLQDKGSRGLSDGLKATSSLTTLDVSSNKYITTMGVRFIADGIRHNNSLTVFTFADNIGTGDGGASSLADAIKQSSTLREVNLSNNGITSAGKTTLQQAAKSGCELLL